MILGISLVVNELNKGQRMVFRYPESIPSSIENGPNKGLIKLYKQYFSLSLENLAKLFRPKNALFGKVLEISIDELCFYSYPCQCQGLSYEGTALENDITTNAPSTSPTPMLPQTSSLSVNNAPTEVITMFNVIIATISAKAMRKINPDYEFKCFYNFASLPGADPVATALGLRTQSNGICRQTLRRLVEAIADALLQQERANRYVTQEVTLMLHILDNWQLAKQLDASSTSGNGGVPVMESGLMMAAAVSESTGERESAAAVTPTSRSGAGTGTGCGPGTGGDVTMGIPGVSAVSGGSLGSTPRSSRSNSSAPLLSDVVAPGITAGTGASGSASGSAGGTTGTGPGPSGGARHSRTNSNASVEAGGGRLSEDGGGSGNSSKATVGSAGRIASPSPPPPPLGSQSGIAHSLSIDTDLVGTPASASGRTSPALGVLGPGTTLTPLLPPHLAQTQHTPASVALALMQGSGKDLLHGHTPTAALSDTASLGSLRGSPVHQTSLSEGSQSHPNLSAIGAGGSGPTTTVAVTSRANSGLAPLPSRASSGLSTTPNKATVASTGGLSGSSVGSASNASLTAALSVDGHSATPVNRTQHLSEWGPHLMYDFMARSLLANELRSVYYNLAGGHSLNVTFNSAKFGSTALFCKDRKACEESAFLRSLRYGIDSDHLLPAGSGSSGSGGGGVGRAITSIGLRGLGGSMRSRQSTSGKTSGNLNSALGSLTPRLSFGKKSRDSAKMKGINLNSQTMLRIADSDTIMNVLHSLDSTTFNVIIAGPDAGSEGNSAGSSSADFQTLQQQMRIHSSSRLFNFIEASDPTKSFLDLSLDLDEPVEELVSMANYLRSWGLAEVIPVIYSRSCYRIHNKVTLHRDSRAGRAFEALLLALNVPLWEPDSAVGSRVGSEPYLSLEDGLVEPSTTGTGTGSGVGASVGVLGSGGEHPSLGNRRRGSSIVSSTDGSYDTTARGTLLHHMGRQQPSTQQLPSQSGGTPLLTSGLTARGHYLVSPVISRYRQRRGEGMHRDDSYLYGSLRNSRSSEGFLKGLGVPGYAKAATGIHAKDPSGDLAMTPQSDGGLGITDSGPPVPSLARSATESAATVAARLAAAKEAETARVGATPAPAVAPSATAANASQKNDAKPAQSVWSKVFFGQTVLMSGPSASQSPAPATRQQRSASQPQALDGVFREVDSVKNLDSTAGQSGRSTQSSSDASRKAMSAGVTPIMIPTREERSHSNNSNEVVISQSYPPSSLSNFNLSNANREMGFQHVVVPPEEGKMTAPPTRSTLQSTLNSILHHNNHDHTKSPYSLDDFAAGVQDDGVPVVPHNLDVADNIPPQYSLPVVLAAFDGARVLTEVTEHLPPPLREFTVDIVIFLLRWHVIVPVDTHIVNMQHLLSYHTDPSAASFDGTVCSTDNGLTPDRSVSTGYKTAYTTGVVALGSAGNGPMLSSSGGRVSFGGEHSAFSVSPSTSYALSCSRGFGESKSNLSHLEDALAPLRAQLPPDLSPQEASLSERLLPFVLNSTISTKTVREIARVLNVEEEDILHLIAQLPFLHTVKKLAT